MSRIATLVLILVLMLCACTRRQPSSSPLEFSYHTAPHAQQLRRVVVLPLYRGTKVGASAERLDLALATSLRETNLYEVATVTREQRDVMFEKPLLGLDNLTPDGLRRFRDASGADAILIGRVDHFDCYDPIAIGLEVHLISCRDGSTAWSANGHFDSRRDDVQESIRDWHRHTMSDRREQIGGWQSVLQSPSLYARYVADQLTSTLLPQVQR